MKVKNLKKVINAKVKREVDAILDSLVEIQLKDYYSKKEVAMIFGISERTIDRWREDGKIFASKRQESGILLFSREQINQRKKDLLPW